MIIPDLKALIQNFRPAQQVTLPGFSDDLGSLNYWENSSLFPQGIQRSFWITQVKIGETRGSHAHFLESQVLVAVAGELSIRVEGVDGSVMDWSLSSPSQGLYVPPLNWVEVRFGEGAALLGLSDRAFDESDYIRDKNEFGNIQKGNF